MGSIRDVERQARRLVRENVPFLEQYEDEPDENGNIKESVCLGTVFSLTPSGKYYTPFANGNVEPCHACQGHGTRQDKQEDCRYCQGQGTRSIREIALTRSETEETTARLVASNGAPVFHVLNGTEDVTVCWVCDGRGWIHPTCHNCQGMGSREALLDSVWQEAAEEEAGRHGCCVESGEGDPCDVFLTRYTEAEEEEDEQEEQAEAPEDGDYTISDTGPLGSLYGVGIVQGAFLGTFKEWDEAIEAIKAKMEKDQYWPSVWYESDHGNVSSVSLCEKEQVGNGL